MNNKSNNSTNSTMSNEQVEKPKRTRVVQLPLQKYLNEDPNILEIGVD